MTCSFRIRIPSPSHRCDEPDTYFDLQPLIVTHTFSMLIRWKQQRKSKSASSHKSRTRRPPSSFQSNNEPKSVPVVDMSFLAIAQTPPNELLISGAAKNSASRHEHIWFEGT
ncbi:unnamed protein product [Lathyrus oleraceus]